MISKSLGRKVAIAAATTTAVGVLPFFGAASAFAAEPTGITVTPTAKYVNQTSGGSVFTGSLTGASGTLTHGVFFNIYSGPDATPGQPLVGTTCPISGTSYTCTVNQQNAPGVDSIRFFYDAAGTGSYQNGDPVANGTLTISGAVNSVTLTPTTAHAAQGQYQAYTVNASDAQGRPVPGTSIDVTATQTNATSADLFVTGTKPAPGATTGPPAAPTPGGNGTTTGSVTTSYGTNGDTPGAATVYASSTVTGTVSLKVSPTGGPNTVSSTGTLSVDAAGLNDVTSVVVTPATQTAFTSKTVQETVTLRNAQGDPVAGVTPVVTITAGPDAGSPVTVLGATDGTGQATATFTSGSAAGTDTVQAFVNQTNHTVNTSGLDSGEPSGTASVVIAAEHVAALTGGSTSNVPLDTKTVPVTFTLTTDNGSSPAGYNVNFTVTPTVPAGRYTLSQTSGVTGADGTVTVSVTDATPANGDSAVVTATLVGDATKQGSNTVNWQARTAQTVVITPYANTAPTHGSTTHTVSATDQFGSPVTGLTFTWSVTGRNNANNNLAATGTGSSFIYTDVGPLAVGGSDFVTVTASSTSGSTTTVVGSDQVQQYWVRGTAQAAQANIDAQPYNGSYVQATTGGPFVPQGFAKSASEAVSSDPTAMNTYVQPKAVAVKLVDANGDPLYGKSVTFTSTGVGGFTDQNGTPSGTSTAALVEDGYGSHGDPGDQAGWATVYVRSTQSGTQTITASVDGLIDTATVTYSGQYVPVTPERVLDTRNGQGSLSSYSGNNVVAGRLAPNTNYFFNYASTDMPTGVEAYAFNVTAIQPNGLGNLRVDSNCNGGNFGFNSINNNAPQTSLINYQVGKDVANFAIVANCRSLKIFSEHSTVAVAVDLVGYYPTSEGIRTIDATRVVDTRIGLGGGSGAVTGGTSRSFQIAGTAGIPVGTKAVALNVTAIRPTGLGNLRIYPNGAAVPNASNINYIPGIDKAAFVVVNLPANGKIDVYSDGGTVNLAVDAFAYYPPSSTMVTAAPVRVLDTRSVGTLKADTVLSFQVAGKAGVPADAQAVLVSVTGIHAVGGTGVGNLRIYPAGGNVPNVSTLNYVSKTTDVANFAIVKLGSNGRLSLYSAGSLINVAVDVVGYTPAGGLL